MRTLVFVVILVLSACSSNNEVETITDSSTKITVDSINKNELESGQVIFHHGYDNMDRGNHDLEGNVVVDIEYFNSNEIQRGDIVYYQPPKDMQERMGEFDISRVVGFPGEKLEIIEGQIYINGMLLDTFYGRAHRLGSDISELKEILNKDDLADHIRQNIKNNIDYFQNTNMDEILIPENAVFVVGDDWLRSNDSKYFGPISLESVEGKVLGRVFE